MLHRSRLPSVGEHTDSSVSASPRPLTIRCHVNGTAVVMSEQIRQHKEELHIFRQVENYDLALKSQLINVFDETYFRGLRNRHTGFSGVSYFQMISQLYVNYGTITAVDLIENERRMDIPFNQSGAIETYLDQIEDAVEFAEAGASPFTMVQITTKEFIQMFATGLFKDKFKAWNRLPQVSRDWANFKLIFTAAAQELREMQAMTGTAGYANSVTADLMTQTSEAISTLEPTKNQPEPGQRVLLPHPWPYQSRRSHKFHVQPPSRRPCHNSHSQGQEGW